MKLFRVTTLMEALNISSVELEPMKKLQKVLSTHELNISTLKMQDSTVQLDATT